MVKTVSYTKIHTLYKSRKILFDILGKRGYNVEDYNNNSINDINLLYNNNQLNVLLTNESNNKIFIQYHLNTKLSPKYIYEIIDELYNLEKILANNDELIILIKHSINATLLDCISRIFHTDNIYINIFNINDLLFNVLEHTFVPPLIILNNQEKKEIKKKYNITNDSQFPSISRFDPVAKLIGLRPGQVCEITRPSKTAIISKYYRLCY